MTAKRSRQTYEVDLSNQESPFVLYGTPLPPLDDHTRDDGSYVPVWKQEVTDDRGRKRLHGAFTGGLSAGYFNTVGSKEGWIPATFVSSRSNRMKDNKDALQQKAEDYMDEEDIREAEESKHISTTDGFAGFGTEDDPIHRNAMADFFKPVDDSMGFKLLNRMGWRQGQGIGPRVKRKAEPDDPSSESHLFAPSDVPMISFAKKTDHQGLGYNGATASTAASTPRTGSKLTPQNPDGSSGEEDDARPGLTFASRKSKNMKPSGGGMGIGVLNDTGSDDDDPYSMGPKISYNKTLGGNKKPKKKAAPSIGNSNPLLKSKPIFVSKKFSSMQSLLRKCHDGRLPLPGFVLSDGLDGFSAVSVSEDRYRPPEVPEGWQPSRAVILDDGQDAGRGYQSTSSLAKASTHTTASRASALGEVPLLGKSVFDFLSPSARDRLVKTTGKTNLPQALGESLAGTHPSPKSIADVLPKLDLETASQALARSANGGFMPYAEDLAKRQRYRVFLEISAGVRNEVPTPPASSSFNNDEYINELNEFVRAAEVFRPVSGGLGSRFTSSSSSSVVPPSTLSGPGNEFKKDTEDLVTRPHAKPEDPAEVAAKLGMFGPLTRTIFSFSPARLVAKRFGVEYVGTGTGTTFHPTTATTTSHAATDFHGASESRQDEYQQAPASGNIVPLQEIGQNKPSSSPRLNRNLESDSNIPIDPLSEDIDALIASTSQQNLKHDIDIDRNEALEQKRPGQAIFRAIFGSDDEGEDGDDG